MGVIFCNVCTMHPVCVVVVGGNMMLLVMLLLLGAVCVCVHVCGQVMSDPVVLGSIPALKETQL